MVNCMPYCRNITTNKIMIKAAAGIFILSESAILTTRGTNPTAHEMSDVLVSTEIEMYQDCWYERSDVFVKLTEEWLSVVRRI